MSASTIHEFYTETYVGTHSDEEIFPALCAHATRIVDALTHWQVTDETIDSLHPSIKNRYLLAVCAQIDFLAENGLESINDTTGGGGFTVGKVTVHAASSSSDGVGAMRRSVSPAALLYLEQTGLMNPQVPTADRWC